MVINTKSWGIAVDIDETLSWTVGYWVMHLCPKLGNPEKLTPEEFKLKYQFVQNIPYWKGDKLNELINDLTYNNDIQFEFPIITGANRYLKLISKKVNRVVYVSKRPEVVRSGTKNWLKNHNFPEGDLILKPLNIPVEKGNYWKSEIIKNLYPDVKGIIDDDQEIIEYLGEEYKGYFFLFGQKVINNHKHNIIPCDNWKDIYNQFKLVLNNK